jgi:hypothetical protein
MSEAGAALAASLDGAVEGPVLPALQAKFKELMDKKKQATEASALAKRLSKEADELEVKCIDLLELAGLDGAIAHDRTWWVQEDVSISVLKENRDKVLAAAAKVVDQDGVSMADEIRTVLTGTLKSWLKEQAKNRGVSGDARLADGTPFEGLVQEFRSASLHSAARG